MARRYDHVGAALRVVFEAMASRAPRPPRFEELEETASAVRASGPLRVRPLVAVLAAVIVVAAIGSAATLFGGGSSDEEPVDSTIEAVTPTTAPPPGTTSATTTPTETTVPLLLRSAPWSFDPLQSEDVDEVLLTAWSNAGNRGWCSLLAPTEVGPEGEGAVTRAADFGPDAWAISWDKPAGPGMRGDSSQCGDCGRSAFGVAGTSLVVSADHDLSQWSAILEWADGSRAGYNHESQRSGDDPPLGHRQNGEVVVVGQACLYNVWSNLGADHMDFFLAQLRFVEGHEAEPVEVRGPDDPPAQVVNGGDAPWEQTSVAAADVPSALVVAWRDSAAATPLVTIEGLSDEFPLGQMRRADLGAWGVAWDNPDGPGHDGFNSPCRDCGRGAVGLAGTPDGDVPPGYRPYGRVDWNDGSFAVYDLRLGSQGLPPDRVVYTDPTTGEPVPDGWEAQLFIEGTNSMYTVWTHLGEDHLIDLLGRIRFVDLAP